MKGPRCRMVLFWLLGMIARQMPQRFREALLLRPTSPQGNQPLQACRSGTGIQPPPVPKPPNLAGMKPLGPLPAAATDPDMSRGI
eukprot:4141814-Pyramimonas_sp.AAC.1